MIARSLVALGCQHRQSKQHLQCRVMACVQNELQSTYIDIMTSAASRILPPGQHITKAALLTVWALTANATIQVKEAWLAFGATVHCPTVLSRACNAGFTYSQCIRARVTTPTCHDDIMMTSSATTTRTWCGASMSLHQLFSMSSFSSWIANLCRLVIDSRHSLHTKGTKAYAYQVNSKSVYTY